MFPICIYLFRLNYGNTRNMWEISSKLTVKTPERRRWLHFSIFMLTVNVEFNPCVSRLLSSISTWKKNQIQLFWQCLQCLKNVMKTLKSFYGDVPYLNPLLYPTFSDVFRGYGNETIAWNGLGGYYNIFEVFQSIFEKVYNQVSVDICLQM